MRTFKGSLQIAGIAAALMASAVSLLSQAAPPPAPPLPKQILPPAASGPLIRPVVPTLPAPPTQIVTGVPGTPIPGLIPPPTGIVSPAAGPTTPPTALKFDTEFKELASSPGDTNVQITFWVTNTHTESVLINAVRPSCGCTVAKLPEQPWKLAPGASGPIEASLDLRGKFGVLTKSLTVDSTSGFKSLLFKVTIPDAKGTVVMSDPDRLKNMQLMLADRQVVFKDAACAKCHMEPTVAKLGQPLYQAGCAICHDSVHRATMVPDLRALKHPTNADHWRRWIAHGRAGSLMPAFAKSEGGPLTDLQIESLVEYLSRTIPSAPVSLEIPKPAAATPTPIKPSAQIIPAPAVQSVALPPKAP